MIKDANITIKKIVVFFLCIFIFSVNFAQEKVRVQFKWKHQFQFAGYYAAKENGYYKKNGMDVELIEYFNEAPVEAVLSGKAEFGIGSSEIIMEKAKGKKIVLLASIFQHSPYIFISRKNRGIDSIHDLADKKIAVDKSAAELILYLKAEGIDTKKLNFVDNPFDLGPLIEGKIDITAAYTTDEIFRLKELGIEYNQFNPRASGIDFYGDSIFTSEEFLKSNPEVVEKFVRESLRGWEYALENKAELTEIILGKYSKRHSRKHLMFEANESEKLILHKIVSLGYINHDRWKTIAESYKEMGLIPEDYSLNNFFYNSKVELDYNMIKNMVLLMVVMGIFVFVIVITIFLFNRKLKKEIVNKNKIEEELKKNEKSYKLLAENTVDCIWLLNLETMRFEYISPSIFRLRGLTVEEAIVETLEQSLTTESLKKVQDATEFRMKNFINGNRDIETMEGINELKQYKKDGTIIDVEVSTKYIYDEKSDELKVVGVSRDITERKNIEKRLAKEIDEKNIFIKKIIESEKKLKELLVVMEQIPRSIVITDMSGVIRYVNQYLLDISGYKKEEIIGKTPRIFKSGKHQKYFYKEIWREISSGKEWKGEIINEKRDGEQYKESVTIAPVKDEKGEIYSYIAVKELIKL